MARRRNFEFLAFHTFGPPGKTVVELCIIGFLMGTCIAFFVVVGDLGPGIVAKTLNINNTSSLREMVLIGLAVFVVLPLGFLRNVDSLSSVCTATIGFYLCLVLKVIGEAMAHLVAGDWVDKVYLWRPAGLLQCIPIFSMALFCQTQLFEIYDSLPNASLDKMNGVIRAAVNLCTAFYICVGFFGYVAFCTQNFTGNVLMSFTPTLTSDVIKMGFVLSVAVSFPLAIFPCRASLFSLLYKRVQMHHHEAPSSYIPETRFKCLTISIISVSLAVGLLIPNIELVLGLVGSTIGVLICVMFPAVAFICISTKSSQERLLAQALVFIGVLILVLGTYATLYAASESGDDDKREAISPVPDHFDSISRMTLVQVDKPAVDKIVVDKPDAVEELKVKLKESGAEPKQEALAEKMHTSGQNVPVEQVKQPDIARKPNIRQEPPVPVEPAAVQAGAEVEVKKVKQEKDVVPAALQHVKQQVAERAVNVAAVNKDLIVDTMEEKKNIPDSPAERGKVNIEQVNQDAIKKEDEEMAEDEKQAEDDSEQKNKELLRKLEEHKEEQKKLLQEQKQILEELKEHKKDIEQAVAAKQKSDDNIPKGSFDIGQDGGVKPEGKIDINNKQSIENIPNPQNGVPGIMMVQNKNDVGNDIQKAQSEEAHKQNKAEKKDVPQPVKVDGPEKGLLGEGPNHLDEMKQLPKNSVLQGRPKDASINAGLRHQDQKPVLQVQQQDGPVPAPNKLPLPLPLAVRDNTSVFYKQSVISAEVNKADSQKVMKENMQHDFADVGETKVMRRDILGSDKNGFKANDKKESEIVNSQLGNILSNFVSNGKLYEGKNKDHERNKRDILTEEFENTVLVSSIMHKQKNKEELLDEKQGDKSENCEVTQEANEISDSEGVNMAVLSKDKYNIEDNRLQHAEDHEHPPEERSASPQISGLGPASHPEKIPDHSVQHTVSASEDPVQYSATNASISSAYTNMSGKGNAEDSVPNELKVQQNSEDRALRGQEDISASNSIIITPLHLSEPKLNDDGMKVLNEAVMEAKDVLIVAKPMTRDLKSISAVQQMHENNEHNEKK